MVSIKKLILGDHDDAVGELTTLFGGEEPALRWAQGVIEAEGLPPTQEIRTAKALRKAEPRLSLRPATYLARRMAG